MRQAEEAEGYFTSSFPPQTVTCRVNLLLPAPGVRSPYLQQYNE